MATPTKRWRGVVIRLLDSSSIAPTWEGGLASGELGKSPPGIRAWVEKPITIAVQIHAWGIGIGIGRVAGDLEGFEGIGVYKPRRAPADEKKPITRSTSTSMASSWRKETGLPAPAKSPKKRLPSTVKATGTLRSSSGRGKKGRHGKGSWCLVAGVPRFLSRKPR